MPQITNNTLTTIADELLDLVKKHDKMSIEEASKILKAPMQTIQALVDFLVEEKVFGIEYKFTTPYVYMHKEKLAAFDKEKKSEHLMTKEQFYSKAKEKSMPYENIEASWKRYLEQNILTIKQEFFRKSMEKKISLEKAEELWKKYLSYL